jgi:hypothetical protein
LEISNPGAELRTLCAKAAYLVVPILSGRRVASMSERDEADTPRPRRDQQFRRLKLSVPIRISTIDPELDPESGRPYFRSTEEVCENISRGGVFLVTHEPISPGRRLLIEVSLPGGPELQTIGRVAWTRCELESGGKRVRSEIGIEFVGGSTEQMGALEGWVNRSLRRGATAPATPSGPVPRP